MSLCVRFIGLLSNSAHPHQDFTACLEIDPEHFQAYTNRGYAYRKLGNFEYAIKDYTSAINLDDRHTKTLNNRAYCFAKNEQFMEGETHEEGREELGMWYLWL